MENIMRMNQLQNLIEHLEEINDQYNLDPTPKLGRERIEIEIQILVMEDQHSWYHLNNAA
jgi:hypothetical protein